MDVQSAAWGTPGSPVQRQPIYLLPLLFDLFVLCAVLSLSVKYDSLWPHGQRSLTGCSPWGFSRQEYWSGLPCPSPGGLPNPGIEPRSPVLQADSWPSEPLGKLSCKNGCTFEPIIFFPLLDLTLALWCEGIFILSWFWETWEGRRMLLQRAQVLRLAPHLTGAGKAQKWGPAEGMSLLATTLWYGVESEWHPGRVKHKLPHFVTLYFVRLHVGSKSLSVLQNYVSSHLVWSACLHSPQTYLLKTWCLKW